MSYDLGNRFFLYDGFLALCGLLAVISAYNKSYETAVAAVAVAIVVITLRPLVVKEADPQDHH